MGPSLQIKIGLHPQVLQGSGMVGFLEAELLAGGGWGQISTSVGSFSIKNNARDQVNSERLNLLPDAASTLAGRPSLLLESVKRDLSLVSPKTPTS